MSGRVHTTQFPTHEGTSPATDEDHEAGQVRRVIRERVARIVHDGRIVARRKERQRAIDRERQRVKVRDGIVHDPMYSRVLQGDDGVVETGDRDRVDTVPRAGRVP